MDIEELKEVLRLFHMNSNEMTIFQLREYHFLSKLFIDIESIEKLIKMMENKSDEK